MRDRIKFTASRKAPLATWLATFLALAWSAWAPNRVLIAAPQASLQAVTDRLTYNVGDSVRLKVISEQQSLQTQQHCLFTVRFAGEEKPVASGSVFGCGAGSSPNYHLLWKAPLDARAGRYEVDMRVQDPRSQRVIQEMPRICSFVVHRQVIQIVSAEVAEPYYSSGDTIACRVKIANLSGQTLSGLRLEFSLRYWPWIAQQRTRVGTDIENLQSGIILKPHQQTTIDSPHCGVAGDMKQPSLRQYSAVVWNQDRKNVYAIGFTPLVFINPPGVVAPHPYPMQYIYPSLDKVNTVSYREFHSKPVGAGAITFDTRHTQFPSGSEVIVKFALANPTSAPWSRLKVRARLLDQEGKELADQTVAEGLDLNPSGSKLEQEVGFPLLPGQRGLLRAEVEITDGSGRLLATNDLELGVNPLPKSVLVFCAHEDDDSTQMGFIRSLVENQIPLHIIYFTSGDAGSCDRYFQHSCGPAEALNFGAIRMQEARAAMGHLGVPAENIIFMGLPDGGSGKIWYDHPNSTVPYPAVLLASDHAPYDGLFRTNLPFARDAVVEAAKDIVKQFQPDVIFTVHPPAEGHIDHIVNNFFVVKALQDLLRAGAISPDLEVRVDRIFDPREHPATPYEYENHEFYVSGEAMALAQEAGWFYQSQSGNQAEGNLRTWNQLPRSEGYRKVLDWKKYEGWNEKE